ncbi:hypothetical protein [Pseudomonas sp. MWU12-2323]|uniref:hypothetical protein n=1 Tax=Pseudomonas sp. MWU12-2323 TaxID=2651296 RepID=UPI00128B672B|nr:hypothetical protein [Pseudomonas sp. MWU12-2323]MPQ71479.1 hypothetical protein [Pseudomonas sp. MWU12-2323]
MITNEQLITFCVEKLAAEGIPAFATTAPANNDAPMLRVPRLENDRELLCQARIFNFISCKLDGQKRKGFRVNHPVTGALCDIYCYDPESSKESPGAIDLMVWSANVGATFDWTGLYAGDDGWCDGWEMDVNDNLDQRIAFLASLMSYEVIDLPKVAH